MAADLHIHIFEGDVTENDIKAFFSNVIGSKHFNLVAAFSGAGQSAMHKALAKIHKTPDVWIGEVSWLKASLFEDGKEIFIPPTVMQIHEIVGEDLPTVDDEMIERVKAAFEAPNETGYSLAEVGEVVSFLTEHKGKRAFTVSW